MAATLKERKGHWSKSDIGSREDTDPSLRWKPPAEEPPSALRGKGSTLLGPNTGTVRPSPNGTQRRSFYPDPSHQWRPMLDTCQRGDSTLGIF